MIAQSMSKDSYLTFFGALDGEKQPSMTGSRDPVHSILLASSAIPGVFPPVMIDGLFYADGGATANLTLFVSRSFRKRWRELHPDAPLPKFRIWVV